MNINNYQEIGVINSRGKALTFVVSSGTREGACKEVHLISNKIQTRLRKVLKAKEFLLVTRSICAYYDFNKRVCLDELISIAKKVTCFMFLKNSGKVKDEELKQKVNQTLKEYVLTNSRK